MSKDYIFADPNHIWLNLYVDYTIDHYVFLYRKVPFEIRVKVRSDARYDFDKESVVKLIAKKYDELMMKEYDAEVTSRDMRR